MLKKDGLYFAYLRKSREDRDAELRGEMETLVRHKRILNDLAKRSGIVIAKWYPEIVSGETIAARPRMLELLNDIETSSPDGVLVVEIERLARGDTRDQGLIMETFKYADTKIITPSKVYDPNDEFDEEYAEFGLFMSRREYKTINRRLQNGRRSSFREGKWTGNKAPYGYERVKLPSEKGFMLKIVPTEASVVKLIYQLYLHGTSESNNIPIGSSKICRILDSTHVVPPAADVWQDYTIRNILDNPVYSGMLRSGRRKQQKKIVNGIVIISRPVSSNVELQRGMHEAIIDDDTFQEAQAKRKS
ncbi:MAG: recombinase family protein, partial [Hungatella sp.]